MPDEVSGSDLARPLRVAYVADTMASMQMLSGLAERFDVTLVVPASLGDRATNFWPPPEGVKIERVQLPGGRIRFVTRAAAWLARHRESFDVVVALDSLVGALGANLGRRRGGPPVVLQVGRPALEYIKCQRSERSALRIWTRWLGAKVLIGLNERRADGIGTVSEYVARECAKRNDNVRAIAWQGVDIDRFSATCSKADARRQLGLPEDGALVMWRSRFAPEKDPDTFLLAVDRLRSQGRDVHALYMGGEIAEMNERAAALGVELLSGNAATSAEIPLWYVAADVNVQTSKSEGLGVSVAESLACGTPVVVSDIGGLPEVIDDQRRCGAVVPPGDVAATAHAIARFLDDPALAAAAGEAGRKFVAEKYEREATFDQWVELIAGVAQASAAPPTS